MMISAEWALHGKEDGDAASKILSSSGGTIGDKGFLQAIYRRSPGTLEPEFLPNITISWLGGEEHSRLAIAIQESAVSSGGRGFMASRYFCVRYKHLTDRPVTYAALYKLVEKVGLPPSQSGEIMLEEPEEFSARRIADLATPAAKLAAAHLMLGHRVAVIGAEATSFVERLEFLDAVVGLLPYGARTRFSATTWAGADASDLIKLSFTRYPADGQAVVGWQDGFERKDPNDPNVNRYLAALNTGDLVQQVTLLAGDTTPRSLKGDDFFEVLYRLEEPASNPDPDLTDPVEILSWCAELLTDERHARRQVERIVMEYRAKLEQAIDSSYHLRMRFSEIVKETRLLSEHLNHLTLTDWCAFIQTVITLTYGHPISDEAAQRLLEDLATGIPTEPARQVIINSADHVARLRLHAWLPRVEFEHSAARCSPYDLGAAMMWADSATARSLFEALERQAARRSSEVMSAIDNYGYFAPAVEAAYDSLDDRIDRYSSLLRIKYTGPVNHTELLKIRDNVARRNNGNLPAAMAYALLELPSHRIVYYILDDWANLRFPNDELRQRAKRKGGEIFTLWAQERAVPLVDVTSVPPPGPRPRPVDTVETEEHPGPLPRDGIKDFLARSAASGRARVVRFATASTSLSTLGAIIVGTGLGVVIFLLIAVFTDLTISVDQ